MSCHFEKMFVFPWEALAMQGGPTELLRLSVHNSILHISCLYHLPAASNKFRQAARNALSRLYSQATNSVFHPVTNTALAVVLVEIHFLKNLSVPLVVFVFFFWMLPAVLCLCQCWKCYTITCCYSMQYLALCKYTAWRHSVVFLGGQDWVGSQAVMGRWAVGAVGPAEVGFTRW